MPYKYMDPSKFEQQIADLEQLLKNEQELNRQANDMIAGWKAKWESSTECRDAALQAIADAGARKKSAPEQLDEAQGAVHAGDPASPHVIGPYGAPMLSSGETVIVRAESEPVGSDPTAVTASSTSEPEASSSPAPVTSTEPPTPESTDDQSGSSPKPTTEPDAIVSTEG